MNRVSPATANTRAQPATLAGAGDRGGAGAGLNWDDLMGIYKSGQGYWTRMLTGIGTMTLVVSGAFWLWNELSVIQNEAYGIYIQAGTALAVIVGFGALVWYLVNKPKFADFMIATEGEMKKVNWPTRKEITGSTWIVILGTLIMAVLLFLADFGFQFLFREAGVLIR